MTMMLVTHEMGFASEMADRLLMFDKGQIVEEGRPTDVLTNPQQPRTQEFLGAVAEH
jgi:polar amino acid transport system ATP-binding protein